MADDTPTIRQICQKADMLAGVPMNDDEAQEWFERTCEQNRIEREATRGTGGEGR